MSDILIERPAQRVVLLRFNRPAVRNALSVAVRAELVEQLQILDADNDVRCVILAGNETAFAAGADLSELEHIDAIGMMKRDTGKAWDAIANFRKPMISAVRGTALGGGFELALTSDIIVAGEGSRLGLPEVKLGLIPGGGGTQRLIRIVGKHRALLLLFTGRAISGKEALEMGLISQLVPDAEVEPTAVDLATRIAAMPPLAIRLLKEVALFGADGPLSTGLALERRAVQLLCASQDKTEGVQAFLQKRAPQYQGA